MFWNFRRVLQLIRDIIILSSFSIVPLFVVSIDGFLPDFKSNNYMYWLFHNMPYALFLIVAFLGLKLNQIRIFYIALMFDFSYVLVTIMPYSDILLINRSGMALILSVATPLSVALILFLGEGPIIGIKSFVRFLICVVPVAVFIYVARSGLVLFEKIVTYKMIPLEFWNIPVVSLLLVASILVAIFIIKDISSINFNVAALLSFIPVLFTFNAIIDTGISAIELYIITSINFSAICFILLYALYRIYWQKAYIDDLTSLQNRRALNEHLRTLGKRYTIAMIDIDHFKKFNDTYGHGEGDNVLRYVACHFNREEGSRVFRYGGEEFNIVYRGKDAKDVYSRVEKIRKMLAQKDFYIRTSGKARKVSSKRMRGKRVPVEKVKVTVSIGLACRTWDIKKAESVIKEADMALYQAKEQGRNRVVVARHGGVIPQAN